MIDTFKKLFGTNAPDFGMLVKQGAAIVDVRTKAEFQGGHIQGAVNIPLNNLSNHYATLDKNKPVITCCASGVRSEQASAILKANGFTEVYNGGGWINLKNKIGK